MGRRTRGDGTGRGTRRYTGRGKGTGERKRKFGQKKAGHITPLARRRVMRPARDRGGKGSTRGTHVKGQKKAGHTTPAQGVMWPAMVELIKRIKHYGTPGSQVITQPSTDEAH